ncbi:MAG: MFS transporter [Bacillota bacterium]
MEENQGNRVRLIILIFSLMLLQGFMDNIRGVLIPTIKSDFGVNYTNIASMMFLGSLGYITATFTGGMISEKIGQRKLIILGYGIIFLSFWGISRVTQYYTFVFFMFLLGCGMGYNTIGASTLAPKVFIKNQGIMMNLMHFFYGAGSVIGPRFTGALLIGGLLWRDIYKVSLIVIAVFFLYFCFCPFPKAEQSRTGRSLSINEIFTNKKVMLFSLLLGFYVSSEIGIANWLVTYLQDAKGKTPLISASYLSAYFMIFTFGRLIGGFIMEKIGYIKGLTIFILSGLICCLIGILGNDYFIPVCGFFISIVYPTMITVVMKSFKEGLSSILGIIMTAASGINMFGNWIVGKIYDLYGAETGFGMIGIYLAMTFLLWLILRRELKDVQA